MQTQWEPLGSLAACAPCRDRQVSGQKSPEISPLVTNYRSVHSYFSSHRYFLRGTTLQLQKLVKVNWFIKLQALSVLCLGQVWTRPGKLIKRLVSAVSLILN